MVSAAQPPDPDPWLPTPRTTAPGAEGCLTRLGEALDVYRRILSNVSRTGADPDPRGVTDLRKAEQAVGDCLRALGWRPATEGAEVPACPDPLSGFSLETEAADADRHGHLARAARDLVERLAAADRDSRDLTRYLSQSDNRDDADVLRAARHCHALVAEALLLGAVDLADRLGVPDDQLPLEG